MGENDRLFIFTAVNLCLITPAACFDYSSVGANATTPIITKWSIAIIPITYTLTHSHTHTQRCVCVCVYVYKYIDKINVDIEILMHYYLSGFDCGGRFRCRFCIPSRCPAPPVISFCFGVSQRGAIDVIGRRPPKSHANTETDAKEWKMRHWDTERLRQRELRLSSWWRTLFGIDEPPRVTLNRPTDGVGFRLIQCHHLTGFFQHSALIFFFFFWQRN